MKQFLHALIQLVRKWISEKLHYRNANFPYYITILTAFVIFVVALNGFVEITEELVEAELTQFDTGVTNFILSWRTALLTDIFLIITHLGGRVAYLAITVLLAAFFVWKHRSRKFILQAMLVLLLASLSNVVLKEVINRTRPPLEHLVFVSTLSYPSGHAMTAMAFYGFLIYLTVRFRMELWVKAVLVTMMVLLISLIGTSRIYLGVHYPSDVLAGFIGGLIWVAFCVILFNALDLLRIRKARMKELSRLSQP